MSETLVPMSITSTTSSTEAAPTADEKCLNKFEGDGLPFKGKLIGMEYLSADRDEKVCLDSMFKLKAIVRARGEHKQRIQINLTMSAVKVIDDTTKAQIASHEIERISFVVIDPHDTRAFGYIYNTSDDRHQFWAIKAERPAVAITLALKELFELAFEQFTNAEKAKEDVNKPTLPPSSPVSHRKSITSAQTIPAAVAVSLSQPPPPTSVAKTTTENVSSTTIVQPLKTSQQSVTSLETDDLFDLDKLIALFTQPVSNTDGFSSVIKSSSSSINVCKGDLITQQIDVIVVCSSSQYLFNSICKAGGDVLSNSYNAELKKDSEAAVIAVKSDGKVASKRVYFLPWKTNSDTSILRQSIEKFVSNAMEKAAEENYRSIAFPAIGCGKFGCSISLVAQTMVEEAHRQQQVHNISVSFVIQPERTDIYNEFQKQINLVQPEENSEKLKVSTVVGKGIIEVEKGDITMQQVDVIIGSSSSGILRKAIIKAAGNVVQTAYDIEYKNNANSILIVTPPGTLLCKRIFFIKWQPDTDEEILQQSLIDLIWTVVQNTISHKFTSIAFPAIGCGQHRCSVDIVVKTMVKEMKKHLLKRNLPWTVKFIVQPNQQNIYDEFCKQVLTTQDGLHESQTYKLPLTWEKSIENKIRFILPTTSNEYESIVTNFDQAMKGNYTQIIQIERIQNERWYMQYIAHSKDFTRRLNMDTEKRLYHGCPEQAANLIMEDCFNRSFAGVNGTVYGFGVYFSSDATYSHSYAKPNTDGQRYMFVARVLVGKTTTGNSSMKTRPLGFDSTTDNKHIFVTYHDAQAFAEYLITYK